MKILSLIITLLAFFAGCQQSSKKEPPYVSNDTSYVQPPAGFTGSTGYARHNSLFDDFISDVLDKSGLQLQLAGEILCIERGSPGRSSFEAAGNGINIRLKNEEQATAILFIDGKEIELENIIEDMSESDSSTVSYGLNCESIRRFTFGGLQYTYLNLGYYDCNGSACSVAFHLLYDHEAGRATMFRTAGMADYFLLGNVNADDKLDLISFSEVNEGGFTELSVQTLSNGSFVPLKNSQGEPLSHGLQLHYDDEGRLYQIDVWERNWSTNLGY